MAPETATKNSLLVCDDALKSVQDGKTSLWFHTPLDAFSAHWAIENNWDIWEHVRQTFLVCFVHEKKQLIDESMFFCNMFYLTLSPFRMVDISFWNRAHRILAVSVVVNT